MITRSPAALIVTTYWWLEQTPLITSQIVCSLLQWKYGITGSTSPEVRFNTTRLNPIESSSRQMAADGVTSVRTISGAGLAWNTLAISKQFAVAVSPSATSQ